MSAQDKQNRIKNKDLRFKNLISYLLSLNSSTGFTLIELLVTITIVGVIFGLIITSSGAVKTSSRDTQRKADLAKIQTALEQYHADKIDYPTSLSDSTFVGTSYLSAVPPDPTTGTPTPYCYLPVTSGGTTGCDNSSVANSCQKYILYARLETASAGTLSCGGTNTYNYSVSP